MFKEIAKQMNKEFLLKNVRKALNSSQVQTWIIDTIQARLYYKGEDSAGDILRTDLARAGRTTRGFYANTTERIKGKKNQRQSNVTLTDSGDFYNSFDVEVGKDFYIVDANFNKSDGHIFNNFTSEYSSKKDFENLIASLNEDELDTFIDSIFSDYFLANINFYFDKILSKCV